MALSDISKKSNRFSAFNPAERQIMLRVMEGHINTIGEVLTEIGWSDGVQVGRYFAVFEDLIREISEA